MATIRMRGFYNATQMEQLNGNIKTLEVLCYDKPKEQKKVKLKYQATLSEIQKAFEDLKKNNDLLTQEGIYQLDAENEMAILQGNQLAWHPALKNDENFYLYLERISTACDQLVSQSKKTFKGKDNQTHLVISTLKETCSTLFFCEPRIEVLQNICLSRKDIDPNEVNRIVNHLQRKLEFQWKIDNLSNLYLTVKNKSNEEKEAQQRKANEQKIIAEKDKTIAAIQEDMTTLVNNMNGLKQQIKTLEGEKNKLNTLLQTHQTTSASALAESKNQYHTTYRRNETASARVDTLKKTLFESKENLESISQKLSAFRRYEKIGLILLTLIGLALLSTGVFSLAGVGLLAGISIYVGIGSLIAGTITSSISALLFRFRKKMEVDVDQEIEKTENALSIETDRDFSQYTAARDPSVPSLPANGSTNNLGTNPSSSAQVNIAMGANETSSLSQEITASTNSTSVTGSNSPRSANSSHESTTSTNSSTSPKSNIRSTRLRKDSSDSDDDSEEIAKHHRFLRDITGSKDQQARMPESYHSLTITNQA